MRKRRQISALPHGIGRSTSSRSRYRLAVAIGMAGLLVACGGNDDPTGPTPLPPLDSGSGKLKFFEGESACASLETYVETTAEAMLREQLESLRWQGREGLVGTPVVPAPAVGTGAAAGDSAAPPSPTHSTTNVRTTGVDEADPVKNNGTRLFTLKSSSDGVVLSRIELGANGAMTLGAQARWSTPAPAASSWYPVGLEQPEGLYLLDDARVLALSRYGVDAMPYAAEPVMTDASASMPHYCDQNGCGGYPSIPPSVRIRLIDADSSALATQWDIRLNGRLIGSRRIGDRLHLVTESALELPDGVRGWPVYEPSNTRDSNSWNAAIDRQIAENARLIPAASLVDWLAPTAVQTGDPTAPAQPAVMPTDAECASYARVDAPSRLSWLRIASVNLTSRQITHQTALGAASGFYMSGRSLILMTPTWSSRNNGLVETYLHRFTAAEDHFRYQGSGRIEGSLINDYAIDESADGVVRLAASRFADGRSETYLATYQPDANGEGWQVLGRTAAIAPGETLQSARFMGDRAYLVTFRQVDPFFVFDLSDPQHPTQLGELKIPGFSSYLHPVGEGHILGIGFDGGGWPVRIKASLFDVRDPANPIEQSTLLLGDAYTESDAIWDPHAFAWYAPDPASADGTMSIPVRSYGSPYYGTRDSAGVRVVSVRPGQGSTALSLTGTLAMDDLLTNPQNWQGWRAGDAKRSIFVGDSVYAIGDGAVRSAPISAPATPQSTLIIP